MRCFFHPDKEVDLVEVVGGVTHLHLVFNCEVCGRYWARVRNWELISHIRKGAPDYYEVAEEERKRRESQGILEVERKTEISKFIYNSEAQRIREMTREEYLTRTYPGYKQALDLQKKTQMTKTEKGWAKRKIDKGNQSYADSICMEVVKGYMSLEEALQLTKEWPEYRRQIKDAAKARN